MEKQKQKVYLVVTIVILIILILGLVGYIVWDAFFKDTPEADNNSIQETVNTQPETIPIPKSIKIEKEKDYVFNANYSSKVLAESYTTDVYSDQEAGTNVHRASDMVVPYINIDSEDANKANENIKLLYEKAISVYNEGVNNHISYIKECNYQYNIEDQILSVLLTYAEAGTDIPRYEYTSYHFDLNTGEELTFEEVCTKLGLQKSEIDRKVKNAITNYFREASIPDANTYVEASYKNYTQSVQNQTIPFYIKEDKTVEVAVTLNIPAGSGSMVHLFTIE